MSLLNHPKIQVFSLILLLVVVVSATQYIYDVVAQNPGEKIYVAFIWHYHQPWYYSPDETYFILPWVRMHSIGNYYKMAYILSKYPEVKVTFTFSGSLLEQLVDYVENGKMDKRQIISWKIVNGTLTEDDVFEMLRIPGGFFDINWARIVNNSPRFRELRDLAQSLHSTCAKTATSDIEYKACVVGGFTQGDLKSQNIIDLAVLFNLLWIDPQVAREEYPEIYGLMQKAYNESKPQFTVEDLIKVLNTQLDIMQRIIPTYRELATKGQIEIIPVPYSHPLAPLLVDAGLLEDLEMHVRFSIELFKEKFNITPRGVWPAEQAVNEFVVQAFRRAGVTWTVTDESILAATGVNTNDIEYLGVPWYIDFPEGRIYIVFRETDISNMISFQYANWDQDKAVEDLVNRILSYRTSARGPRLVVIALDGENPWENYPEFGTVFLNKLYAKLVELQKQGVIETITPGEFIERFSDIAKPLPQKQYRYLDLQDKDISNMPVNSYGDAYSDLPRRLVEARLPEGSWSGGELTVWIGDRQENVAFMWMIKAREDIMKKLDVSSFTELYEKYPDVAKYLLKAQASDWWWWYGGDGGGSAAPFDPLFKSYLARAYTLAGLTPPSYLMVSAFPDGQPIGTINTVAPLLVDTPPTIDGVIENTWSTLVASNKALDISVGRTLSRTYVALDKSKLYFAFVLNTTTLSGIKIGIYFATPGVNMSPYNPGYNIYPRYKEVDLGIHLAREILVDPQSKKYTISRANGQGDWIPIKTSEQVFVTSMEGGYTVEFSVDIKDLELTPGQPAYLAIVLYENENLVEWSSRMGLAYFISVPQPPPEVLGKIIFDMEDPVGDDDGPGGFKYPGNSVFKPGVFDLVRFTIIDLGDKLLFRFMFRNLGGNPWGGPNGWSMQQIHVYVKTTIPDEGRKDTFGLGVEISHGWHFAIIVAPGWGTDPIPKGEKTAIYYYNKTDPIVQGGDLKPYADQATNSIYVEVSKSILYDVENIKGWVIAVLVTSHDGYSENKIRAFTIGGGEWQVNVPANYSVATLKGVLPYVLDVLAPTAEEQYKMLNSFDIKSDPPKMASVHGIPVVPIAAPTPTTTPTTTLTPTPTPTPTSIPTFTQTPTLTPTTTLTTPTTTPTAITTLRETPGGIPVITVAVVIAVVVLLVAIGFTIARRRA